MTATYKIADRVIEIKSIYPDVHDYCKKYRCNEKPDFMIATTQADIDYEREKSVSENKSEGQTIRAFSDSYLEELAIYRKIAESMLDFDTFLFHGSCIAVDAEGYLFTAKSGIGKSTHTHLWRKLFGDIAVMVNDDKPLIRVENNSIRIYGTPYSGKHRIDNNISVPLKAVCLIERAEANSIEMVSTEDVYPEIFQQVYRPRNVRLLTKTLALIDGMFENVKLYQLKCNMDIEAATVAYEGMK